MFTLKPYVLDDYMSADILNFLVIGSSQFGTATYDNLNRIGWHKKISQ